MRIKFLVIVTFLVGMLSSSVDAQTEKGKFLIAGSINPSFSSLNKIKSTTIEGAVKGGYFIANNCMFGLSVDIWSSRIKNSSIDRNSLNSYSFDVINRYYLKRDKLGIFAEVGLGISILNFKTTVPYFNQPNLTINSKKNHLNVMAGAGLNYFITSNVAAELMVYYRYTDEVDESPFYYYPERYYASKIGLVLFIP